MTDFSQMDAEAAVLAARPNAEAERLYLGRTVFVALDIILDGLPDTTYVDANDIHIPTCRICGFELTTSSELLDDTCTRCFTKRRAVAA